MMNKNNGKNIKAEIINHEDPFASIDSIISSEVNKGNDELDHLHK